jgi:hypothetical protein
MGLDRNAVGWLLKIGYLTLTCLLFLLIPSQNAFGQVDEGSITGTVLDATGAVVPGAQVTLLNTDQGITLETRSSGSGVYTFNPVRAGHYKISATARGFSKTTQENVVVNVAQALLVNIQLKLGAATETVEVSTAPPLMQTEEASVGQVISEQQVNDLPLNGRNFTFLAQLGAGMQSPQADTRGNAASGAFSANGLRESQNNYLLDGIDNNSNAVDFLNGTNFVVLPPVDAIAEFKVQTADFSAELGRSAGAVMNASIKSGTNSLHGAAWEFFRNRVLDAADWFEDFGGIPKAAYQQNQFGASIGGPFKKNKMFFFGDYESLHRVEGSVATGAVPSVLEASSGYTNLTEILAAQATATPLTDSLGRSIAQGTVLDPATTREVTAGTADPVTGIVAASSGYVRDPFGYSTCSSAGLTVVTPAACSGLNMLPAARVDPNAVKLLQLYPTPNKLGVQNLFSDFSSNPNLFEHRNAFDVRVDFNGSAKDQVFYRFSYVDDPQYIPGIFGGIADGGSFDQGIQTAHSNQSAGAWTHVFTPNTVNVGRVGFAHLHTTRFGPDGAVSGIPAQFGINGIPQSAENGGLGSYTIGGLNTLGSNNFLPSDEISQTLQLTDDFTHIWGKHSFKMGIENQHVKFDTLQPGFSRGNYDFNGGFTDVVDQSSGNIGLAQFALTPETATLPNGTPTPNGVNYSGGSDSINVSNINTTYDYRTYTALYLQDDWKLSPKLTINLGLRWDYFSPIQETNGGQANFVPNALNGGKATYLIPASGKDVRSLSSTAEDPALAGDGFIDLLAQDGIVLEETNKYGRGLLQTRKANFAPRVGFAYQFDPRLVVRGGFGLFFNSFENQGYGPNIGENYPFVYNLGFSPKAPTGTGPNATNGVYPIGYNSPWTGCSYASAGGTNTIESGMACIDFTPLQFNAESYSPEGLQFNYQTPRTLSTNFTVQYSLTHSLSAQASYVFTQGANLQKGTGTNNVSQIYPANHSTSDTIASGMNEIPWPDFSQGFSYHATVGASDYNGLQTKLEWQNAHGLNFLLTYTWSHTDSDAGDLLNGTSADGNRAPDVPGLGPRFDWGLADFDLRQVVHMSGGYQLPFGKGKDFMNNGSRLSDAIVGGWAINWIATLQGGQPITLGCVDGTAAGLGCNAVKVAGQSQKLGLHKDANGVENWFGNPAAFNQACELGVTPATPTNCIPVTGKDALGDASAQTVGPGFHRLDFSMFKAFQLNERFSLQFRGEFFNILNHPNFSSPGAGGNGATAIGGSSSYNSTTFGEISSDRDNPQDPRQIQFALKLYY